MPRYFRMRHTLEVDVIVQVDSYERAQELSNCIRATFEDENGHALPEDGCPLVSFESDSDMTAFDLFECDEEGNPIEEEQEQVDAFTSGLRAWRKEHGIE